MTKTRFSHRVPLLWLLLLLIAAACGSRSGQSLIGDDRTDLGALIPKGATFRAQSQLENPIHLNEAATVFEVLAEGPILYIVDHLLNDSDSLIAGLLSGTLGVLRNELRAYVEQQLNNDVDLKDIEEKLMEIAARLRRLSQATVISEMTFDDNLTVGGNAAVTHRMKQLLIELDGQQLTITPSAAESDPASLTAVANSTLDPQNQLALGPHVLPIPLDNEEIILAVALEVMQQAEYQNLAELLSKLIKCDVISAKLDAFVDANLPLLSLTKETIMGGITLGCQLATQAIPDTLRSRLTNDLKAGNLDSAVSFSGSALLSLSQDGSYAEALREGKWQDLGTFTALRVEQLD